MNPSNFVNRLQIIALLNTSPWVAPEYSSTRRSSWPEIPLSDIVCPSMTRTSNIISTLVLSQSLWPLQFTHLWRSFSVHDYESIRTTYQLPSSDIHTGERTLRLWPPSEALCFGLLSSSANGQILRSAQQATNPLVSPGSNADIVIQPDSLPTPERTHTTSLLFRFGIRILGC